MDESLSDFQETKNKCKGPKTLLKPPVNKNKIRRKNSKIRGQKDIRKVLKGNELLLYTEDFNKVCEQSGIDVDSEQLQLAIALSKSLHNAGDNLGSKDLSSSTCLTTQERCSKIKTTLQEYGFKVPDIKSSILKKKKSKTKRKQSRLLLMNNEERQQLIADRYSQIIFNTIDDIKSNLNDHEYLPNVESYLYNMCTNQSYETFKNDSAFYVDNLIEKSNMKIGCLLKDWSKIPGRPQSPISNECANSLFTELLYSQIELDTILSGRLDIAKGVIKNKQENLMINDKIPIIKIDTEEVYNKQGVNKIMESLCKSIVPSQTNARSQSPDMFEDDMSSIMDNTIKNIDTKIEHINTKENFSQKYDQPSCAETLPQFLSQPSSSNCSKNKTNDFMDLTDCVNINIVSKSQDCSKSYRSKIELSSQNSDAFNFTRRKSDDFMEITECIGPKSNQNLSLIEESVDLTQKDYSNDTINKVSNEVHVDDAVDLTQSSDSNDTTLPYVCISSQKDNFENDEKKKESTTNNIILENNENIDNVQEVVKESSMGAIEDIQNISKPQDYTNFFDNYEYHHSDLDGSNNSNIDSIAESEKNINKNLTHSSNSVNDTGKNKKKLNGEKNRFSSLGKCDNISLDYDEVYENLNQGNAISIDVINDGNLKPFQEICGSINEPVCENEVIRNEIVEINEENSNDVIEHLNNKKHSMNSFNNSFDNVFEISDEELDYSMQRSKCGDEYSFEKRKNDFEENSIFDNISNVNSFTKKSVMQTENEVSTKISSDSFLPAVEIKGFKVKTKTITPKITPIKKIMDNIITVQTPKNNDYIIKTSHVTPMADYDSLTTPERNKELDKYGLKPFKRKRAIQMLQHLYNQTHPIVEDPSALPSTSKRFKSSGLSTFTSVSVASKAVSPRKLFEEFTKEDNGSCDKENVYQVTNELPAIKEIDCSPVDWVFQKTGKVKVQTCNLPLHIAFHNYVSCRRAIREAILRYEPINIDVIHKDLVNYGFRYDSKELLKFLDKKCITVKTQDINVKNNKKH